MELMKQQDNNKKVLFIATNMYSLKNVFLRVSNLRMCKKVV
jgi:hypothetical protein